MDTVDNNPAGIPTEEANYDSSQIQVLEGLEAVRKRPGMYIGSTGPRGLHHLVYEIVDNSIDEALAGYCSMIEVDLLPGEIIKVSDNGRGIPVGTQSQTGLPAVTVVFTILHAGGKFNALSEWLEVEVCDGEHRYYQRFERGKECAPLAITGDTDQKGTQVAFKADPEIFEEVLYDYDTLLRRLREQAFLNAGVYIVLRDQRGTETVEEHLHYEGGIRSFVEHIHQQKGVESLHDEVIYLAAREGDNTAEVALQYNDSYTELLLSFANNIHTTDGGAHEVGFKAALTRVINDYARRYNILKDNDENLKGEDVREGLTAIISVKLTDAQFEGQTKAKLGNTAARTLVDTHVYDKLTT